MESRTRREKVIISVIDENGTTQSAVIPLPATYEEIVDLSIEILGEYMGTHNIDNIILHYRAAGRCGETEWALLLPRFWGDIVGDGDELRIMTSDPVSMVRPRIEDANVSKDVCVKPQIKEWRGPVVTLTFRKTEAGTTRTQYAKIVTKKSYSETKEVAFSVFKSSFLKAKNADEIKLRYRITDQEGRERSATLHSSENDDIWQNIVRELKKENPGLELFVQELKPKAN